MGQDAGDDFPSVGESVVSETLSLIPLGRLKAYFTFGNAIHVVVGVGSLILFYAAYRLIKRLILGGLAKRLAPQSLLSLGKTVSYVYYILMVMYVMGLLGINLSAVWGAAGIAGIAIGFAAQTSASNLISGMFLLAEKSIRIGDFISVGGVSGTVDMVGLLCVNIHTPDNQMIRIPNSTMLNENLVNYSHFPVRRLTLDVPLSHDADLDRAMEVAAQIPGRCPLVLAEPEPLFYYDSFGTIVTLKVCLWIRGKDLFPAKTQTLIATAKTFEQNGVAVAYSRSEIRVLADGERPA